MDGWGVDGWMWGRAKSYFKECLQLSKTKIQLICFVRELSKNQNFKKVHFALRFLASYCIYIVLFPCIAFWKEDNLEINICSFSICFHFGHISLCFVVGKIDKSRPAVGSDGGDGEYFCWKTKGHIHRTLKKYWIILMLNVVKNWFWS